MCGIAGFVEPLAGAHADDPARTATVRRMCDVIRHRGPDDEGVFVADGAALGMRRLSIIDLAGGHQPIRNEDGSVWVVFNGEIYNYRELRAELTGLGHTFATGTDTETIVHAYEQWGDACFAHLRGMFGIALWDRRSRTLLLARDRMGIKPLYYAERNGTLFFGSEIKSILAAGGVDRTLHAPALVHYLSFLYTPPDRSIFAGISKLPPGHFLRWQGGTTAVRRYWNIPATESFTGSFDDAAERLTTVLTDAVQSHLVSDVPLGALLSGGIDSSLVVGLMARASSRPIKTFSIGFDEPEFDELEGARAVARHFGTDHHEMVVRPDALAIVNDLVTHFDEPFGDSSAVPTWYVSQMARRHVTVVLSGDGGDELFGGYDRYLPHPRVASFDAIAGGAGRRAASAAWPLLPHGFKGKNFLRHVAQDSRGRYVESVSFFQRDEMNALLTLDLRRAIAGDHDQYDPASRFDRFASLSWPSQMMRFDIETYLPEDILTKVDRMSMAHSIESRVPLLDHEVVSFAASLPAEMKILDGDRKRVLKKAAASVLPAGVLTRRKQGFGVPIGVWFRGRLRDFVADTLQSQQARERGYFQPRFVDRVIREHVAGQRDHTLRLWQLLMFELWHQTYLDNTAEPRHARGSSLPLGREPFPQKDNHAPHDELKAASSSF
ncbi:MAG TPA: asparagine synthase (glutamine-hydrolyzing) [Vicinamibacterales bacterium]|nr:asparagine synthase (glutamine-hydrolyzing) [Vicinamibacterales bacterium]